MQNLINVEAWSSIGVPQVIIDALNDQNFVEPTAIQRLTIPPAILGQRDILGAAETGSGKTLAFGIPVLDGILKLKEKHGNFIPTTSGIFRETDKNVDGCESDIEMEETEKEEYFSDGKEMGLVRVINNVKFDQLDQKEKPIKPLYALILTPTRELAIQIKNHLTAAAKYTDINIAVVLGGLAAVKQERILKKGPEIVIATPGRLWELIQEGNAHLSQLSSVRFLVIDETDRMLEKHHFKELHNIIERLNESQNNVKKRQTFVFSATLALVHDIPDFLHRKKALHSRAKIFKLTSGQKLQRVVEMLQMKNPKQVNLTKDTGMAENVTECRIACTIDHKDYYLYYFLQRHPGRTLVFCNSIGCVKRLASLFKVLNCNALPLHASLPQRQRLKNLEKFQEHTNGLLIATDVAARGLDIPNIEHVIHYQVPRTSESYVHRSGRTARAQKEGITVLMMEPSETHLYSRLCKTLNRTEDLPMFPVDDHLLIAVKERVNLAREIDKLQLVTLRDRAKKGWFDKAAKEMDIIVDDHDIGLTMENKETADAKRSLAVKNAILLKLLNKPIFPKGFSGKYLDSSIRTSLQQDSQRAIDVMKEAIKQNPRITKKITVQMSKKNKSKKGVKDNRRKNKHKK